jgi:phage-related baseplate assembly protein
MSDSGIHFLNTDAAQIYDDLIRALENYVKEPLYPGDERRIFAEGLMAVIVGLYNQIDDAARQTMLRYARGAVMDALGERTGTTRLTSSPAHTIIQFETSAAAPYNIIVPQGTKVTSDGTLYFATDQTAVLQAGSTSIDIPATGTAGGSQYNNLLPGTITTLVDLIPLISGVTNVDETHGGDDGEPYTEAGDNSYRDRIRLSSAKFSVAGPREAYEYIALSADPDIASVIVTSPEPGHVVLIPLMEGGAVPSQEVLDKVVAACSADTVRPLTDFVTAQAPTQTGFSIDFVYYVTAGTETDVVQAIEGDGGAIQQYINWQTGAMGRDINPDQLRHFVLDAGALRLDVNEPIFAELDDTTVAGYGEALTVSHEVVDP